MAELNLPLHPTKRHPLTGEPLRAVYVDRHGRARWPIMGAAEDDGDADGQDDGGDDNGGQGGTKTADKGFPEGTPLEQMTTEQREAYWKHQARKHESRSKAFDGLTPEALADLRDRAAKQQELERELMSDKDRAVAEARDAATAEVRAQYGERLVAAEFKAAAAGRIEADRLAQILEPLDLKKFLSGDEVDADRVSAYVDGIAPQQQEEQRQERRGPSSTGAGRRSSSTGPSLQSGAEIYQSRKRRG